MHRKATSKPMRAIMGKMLEFYKVSGTIYEQCYINCIVNVQDWIEFLIFPEEVILNEPIEKWPLCDCLIGFHSLDFPLKACLYFDNRQTQLNRSTFRRQSSTSAFVGRMSSTTSTGSLIL